MAADDGNGAGRATLRDVLDLTRTIDDKVEKLQAAVIDRIDKAMTNATTQLVGKADLGDVHTVQDQLKKHDDRISSLERWRWTLAGVAAVVLFIGSPAVYYLLNSGAH